MKNWFCLIVCLLLAGGAGQSAFARINIVDSVEWMTLDSPLVVRGEVRSVTDTKGPGDVVYRDLGINIQETLKGRVEDNALNVRLRFFSSDKNQRVWVAGERSFLFFLRQGRAQEDKTLEGCWVPRENRQSIIDLTRPERVYTGDMKRANEASVILSMVRVWAARKSSHLSERASNFFSSQDGYLRLEIPWGAEFHSEVFGGSSCYINVPAEPKYRPFALSRARSDKYYERKEGVAMLQNFRDAETQQLLTDLLADPGEAKGLGGSHLLVSVSYPVREVAYRVLVAWGENPIRPLFERKPTEAEIKAVREEGWTNTMREALPKGWVLVSIEVIQAPAGWTRTDGDDGLAIVCRKPASFAPRQEGAEPAAELTLYVIPKEWEGTSSRGLGGTIKDDLFTAPTEIVEIGQISHARYLGRDDPRNSGARRIFISISANSGRENYATRLIEYFGLSLNN